MQAHQVAGYGRELFRRAGRPGEFAYWWESYHHKLGGQPRVAAGETPFAVIRALEDHVDDLPGPLSRRARVRAPQA